MEAGRGSCFPRSPNARDLGHPADLLISRHMAARSFGFFLLGIILGGSAVELIHRVRPAAPAPPASVGKEPPGVQPPTAEQAYRLQDDCVKRGESILDGNVVGSALAQDQVSKYNATTNRCYVLLSVHAADLSEWEKHDNSSYFEDGQTREMLAWYTIKADQHKAFLGFGCDDYYCVAAKVSDCMKGKQCDPE